MARLVARSTINFQKAMADSGKEEDEYEQF
jgi:hypothetical protein